MIKKIAIIGTHGVGKSTTTYQLAAELRMQNHNVIVIPEIARECPFAINTGHTLNTSLWMTHEQALRELEAEKNGFTHIITDRSVLDTFFYSSYFNVEIDNCSQKLRDWAVEYFWTQYEKIIFLRCDTAEVIADGLRMTDAECQHNIDLLFQKILDNPRYSHKIQEFAYSEISGKSIKVDGDTLRCWFA